MRSLETVSGFCPYCGEPVELLVDCSGGDQQYIEDCHVCCKPITVEVKLDDAEPEVVLKTENEV
ncbi:CPXCG motif-containing cysteine-rich protein [Amphritea sp. 1_MG-2023]|uniref:CPXCG motif-containing cysteine-rich protein n=1 Tax=Amphritea sp. 1_MG-2023 TaxID=3062670 RepID=UPI0026E3E9FA|nr:CPXCG motif-containing cysteine-rich protein [Amphritea sp. 1_MG-2023]MDO6563166.1 CPXCG motif-containing cysteine-rich protein [Amphritea sp. 1_MG-2023]